MPSKAIIMPRHKYFHQYGIFRAIPNVVHCSSGDFVIPTDFSIFYGQNSFDLLVVQLKMEDIHRSNSGLMRAKITAIAMPTMLPVHNVAYRAVYDAVKIEMSPWSLPLSRICFTDRFNCEALNIFSLYQKSILTARKK
jgi:hypothetical protein